MERPAFVRDIERAFQTFPIVAILGPRQSGKTTLARMFAAQLSTQPITRFDLEDPTDLARLSDSKLALENLGGLVIIDEIQRIPELFPILRVLVDREPLPAKYLILGSASRDLIRQSSESLAGRIRTLELTPFQLTEVAAAGDQQTTRRLWVRGGFPRSYLAVSDTASMEWRKGFVSTFLERDIPNLGIRVPAAALRRLWMMLTHSHGQILNASGLGRSLQIADTTVRHHLDILAGTYMVRLLPPWFENIAKRQVKAPKTYFRDSGILHALLGLENEAAVMSHPHLGSSWEGFALEEILRVFRAEEGEAFFWSSHGGAELDLLIVRGRERLGFEVKYTSRPTITRSMRIAMEDLKLTRMQIVFPGSGSFALPGGVNAVGLEQLVLTA